MKEKIITTRIQMTWYEKIQKIAEDECRTVNSVVKQAILEFLKRRKK